MTPPSDTGGFLGARDEAELRRTAGWFVARQIALAVVLVLLLLISAGLAWIWLCPHSGTLFAFRFHYRVAVGMTLAEVETILGPAEPAGRGDGSSYFWQDQNMVIWVAIRDGRVAEKWFCPPRSM